jgi:F-type H+-transporting ATPase subunit b
VEHEAAGHEASSGFPPFDQLGEFGVSQVFWLVLTFAVLYFAASNIFLPKIRKALEERDEAIARDVAAAAALSGKADTSVKEFEARIAEAKARARESAAKAKAEADARSAAETARVEADLAARLSKAEASIGDIRAKAMANVSAVAEDSAAAIAEKLTGTKPASAAVKKAVAGVMGA